MKRDRRYLLCFLLTVAVSGCTNGAGARGEGGLAVDQGGAGAASDAASGTADEAGPTGDGATSDAATAGGFSQVTGFGSNPGALKMFKYVPTSMPAKAPLVVALHGCELDAKTHAGFSGWNELADRAKLYIVYPEQPGSNNPARCFNWFDSAHHRRDKGEAHSVKQMIDAISAQHGVDPQRIYVSGLSAGGAMAAALLAAYPEVFAGGAVMAGVPYGCADSVFDSFSCLGGVDKSAGSWAAKVTDATSFSGTYPKVALFHGTKDQLVDVANLYELIEQWTAVHGADQTPDLEQTLAGGHGYQVYQAPGGEPVVEAFRLVGMSHGLAVDPGSGPSQAGQAGGAYFDVGLSAVHRAARFWGLVSP